MILSHCEHGTVFHVACNMREMDKREIYGLRWEDNPFVITNEVMAQRNFAWVGWVDQKPCAVFGGAPLHPGVWSMFMFATDDFPKLALGLTRFCLKQGIPKLFGELKAHRLQAHSHAKHHEAHRWLTCLGARRESVLNGYGRDGSDYGLWVLRNTLDDTGRQG